MAIFLVNGIINAQLFMFPTTSLCSKPTLISLMDKRFKGAINGSSIVVKKRSVDLAFTFGKRVTLTNVLHIPEMKMGIFNLGKLWKEFVFELILSHNDVFIGNEYSSDGLFKFCIVDNVLIRLIPCF